MCELDNTTHAEISVPHSQYTALKYTNRSVGFGTQLVSLNCFLLDIRQALRYLFTVPPCMGRGALSHMSRWPARFTDLPLNVCQSVRILFILLSSESQSLTEIWLRGAVIFLITSGKHSFC